LNSELYGWIKYHIRGDREVRHPFQRNEIAFGYGIDISSWRVCTDLFYLKMVEISPERRMLPKGSVVSSSGKYREYDQDGYRVQELIVDSPEEIHSVIFYCRCDEFSSSPGIPEKARLIHSFRDTEGFFRGL
jgi:hypothetical protein